MEDEDGVDAAQEVRVKQGDGAVAATVAMGVVSEVYSLSAWEVPFLVRYIKV